MIFVLLGGVVGDRFSRRAVMLASDAGRFRFAHALTQHTLYQDLGATRRHRMHARVAQVLEDVYGDADSQVPELAYHWLAATRP